MKTSFILIVLLVAFVGAASAELPGNPASEQILRLREQREKAIAENIAKANAEFAASLEKVKALYPSDPNVAVAVAKEKEALAKVSLVVMPQALKIEGPVAGAAPKAARERPSIHKPEELMKYLIGTKWQIYTNGTFLGTPRVMEFTGPGELVIEGKKQQFKALDKTRILLEGNTEFIFNKDFDEFTGGWIPNPAEKRSGRLMQ